MELERRNLDDLIPQAISNICWSFALLKYRNDPLMAKIGEYIANRPSLTDFYTQAMSNILWSFANLSLFHERMFLALLEEAVGRTGLCLFPAHFDRVF